MVGFRQSSVKGFHDIDHPAALLILTTLHLDGEERRTTKQIVREKDSCLQNKLHFKQQALTYEL